MATVFISSKLVAARIEMEERKVEIRNRKAKGGEKRHRAGNPKFKVMRRGGLPLKYHRCNESLFLHPVDEG
jgi:hypothetical protein